MSQTATAAGTIPGVAVYPGKVDSVHVTKLTRPRPGPGEAVVRVRRVGVCGTDKEIIEAKYGKAPAGSDELVIGHEVLGNIEAVGEGVTELKPGDLVAATVRRPDGCPYCQAGHPDLCIWDKYTERGIFGANGYMVEEFVEQTRYLVPMPAALEPAGVLLEPLTVVEKAVRTADLIQRRMEIWQPKTAVMLGAGPVGLLGTLLLRARGADVYTVARRPAPNDASALVAACGAHYVSTRETSLTELAKSIPNIDLILEATGVASVAFDAMGILGINGVLVLLSVTGGNATAEIPIAALNQAFVLGNKTMVGSVNAGREDFDNGVKDLEAFERLWPGLTAKLITRRLNGFGEANQIGATATDGIKTVLELTGA